MRSRFLFVGVLLLAWPVAQARAASPDDNAKFLAGMPVPSESPLASLAEAPAWRQHADIFNSTFAKVDDRQLSKIRAWSKTNLTTHRPTLFYMFSGPDFLYADAFFPNAGTYVLAGLEPPGAIPDVAKLSKGQIPGVLRSLETASKSLLNISFFITARMQTELRASPVTGTLPVIYVFLARSGKVIRDVSLVHIDDQGEIQTGVSPVKKGDVQGAKIVFATPGGPEQTLYYFKTDLSNEGLMASRFLSFCDKLGDADSFVKSASYLLHGRNFSRLRDFLLSKSQLILQDDTGIPVSRFGPQWQLTGFGRYLGPISIFAGQYQPKMAELFRKAERKPIDFVLGYRWRPNESSLLLAVKKQTTPVSRTDQTSTKNDDKSQKKD